jgi:hypothetical protein
VWLRLAGLVAVLALIVVGVLVILGLGSSRDADETPSSDDPGSSQSSAPKPIRVVGVRDLDPPSQNGNGEEHPEEAGLAADGDPGTAWSTQTYQDGPPLAPYKQGVGLVLDLGSEQSVRSMTVTLGGTGYAFDVYAAPAGARGPTDITGLKRIGRAQDAGGRTQVEVDPVTTRYVVLWLTALAASPDGGFRGSVQEVVVRS